MTRSIVRIGIAAFLALPALQTAAGGTDHAPQGLSAAAFEPQPLGSDSISWVQRQTDGSAIGLVVSNYGFFGNNFVTRNPSMEFPLGSEIDHLIRAGLWVGAINADGDTVVSTGSVSGYYGTSTSGATEFTPRAWTSISERSNLITSRAYSEKAVSEQDFIAWYTDYPRRGTNDAVLNISIRQESYLWSYDFAEAFVIVSFTIRNEGGGLLRAPYLGMFAELASGWKGAYDTWPPSGWFDQKMLEYFPDLRMCGEHHYNFQRGEAPSWGAVALLGTEHTTPMEEVQVTFAWWDWEWDRDNPMDDADRYALMASHVTTPTEEIVPLRDDPIELLAVGPFPDLARGDSLGFVVGFVGGVDRDDLIGYAEWAHRAFQNGYVIPAPPQPSRYRIVPKRGAVTLYWDDYPEDKFDPFYQIADFEGYRIYVTRKEGATSAEFDMIRELDIVNGINYDTGLESVRDSVWFGDTLYTYNITLDNLKDGFKYWIGLTSFDRGMPDQGVESMESGIRATQSLVIPGTPPAADGSPVIVFPNPYRGEAIWDGSRDREKYVWFANLPRLAVIRIYTLAGDLVATINFNGETYQGTDIQGLETASERSVSIPGGIYAWDLISDEDQAVATGLYIYSVEDLETGTSQIGKLMIIR
jgi:hypothetical protein